MGGQDLTTAAARSVEPAELVWVIRAAILSGAILFIGSVWQIGAGLAGAPPVTAPLVEVESGVEPASDAERLRKVISEMESARREAENALILLEQSQTAAAGGKDVL